MMKLNIFVIFNLLKMHTKMVDIYNKYRDVHDVICTNVTYKSKKSFDSHIIILFSRTGLK